VIFLMPGFLILLVFLNRYFFGFLANQLANEDSTPLGFSKLPSVGVVVPLFNEGESIYHTIKSLAQSRYPQGKLEVWVINDGSTDDSGYWAEKAASEHSCVKVICNSQNIGKRLGIARAVRQMRQEFVVSVDSDVIVDSNAIAILMSGFAHKKTAAVGGRVSVANANRNWLTKMQTVKYWVGYEFLKNLENAFGTVLCLSGCLTAYRRQVLLELEDTLEKRNLFGVSIKYGEDRYLTRQIVKLGYETKLDLRAKCITKAPSTLQGYFAQQLRWRRSNIVDFLGGFFHVWRLNPFVAVHYYALYTLILTYPCVLWASAVSGHLFEGFLVHVGILALFGVCYVFGTRHEPDHLRVSPLAFLCMSFVLPATYMVLNILALFTLDSGSWETRKKSAMSNTF
jgi:N-acetylglucosaminyltransferase